MKLVDRMRLIAKQVLEVLNKNGVEAQLVGSVRNGKVQRDSDIDILITKAENMNFLRLLTPIAKKSSNKPIDILLTDELDTVENRFQVLLWQNEVYNWGIPEPYYGLKAFVFAVEYVKTGKEIKMEFKEAAQKCGIYKNGELLLSKGELTEYNVLTMCLLDMVARGMLVRTTI